MKKLLLVAASIAFSAVASYSQVFVEGKNLNDMPSLKVCELLLLEDMVVSPNIKVAVDYGQFRKEFKDKITDKDGTELVFSSAVSALNHMENNGWILIQSVITPKGRGVIYRYYFRRETSVRVASHQ